MIELTINGTSQRLDASPEMPLLWALRDVVGLTGTKFGCGMSLCGACTVHLDGQPVRACMTPVSDAIGKPITTIEGIPADHPVKVAWKELNVPQCGYCQAGQIMSALALLKETPQPTDDDIDVAMSGNLCRCGTYGRIKVAIHNAAKEMAQ
jgi:isoquinoline 1-oxidoreductase alpha subunit